ncbi:MAG: protease complex subunit PrcB family protein [Clostridiaceae bacterium]|nr:protease complex subunit PrcB family protein [Clostridiaceae bacterium]
MRKKLILGALILGLGVFGAGCSNNMESQPGSTDEANQIEDSTSIDENTSTEDVSNGITEDPLELTVIGDISFEILAMSNLSPELEEGLGYIQEHRGFGIVKEEGDDIIVFIGSGEKPTAGYDLYMNSIEKTTDSIAITIGETKPEEGSVVAQVLTYPVKLIRITTDIRNITVETESGEVLENINQERY